MTTSPRQQELADFLITRRQRLQPDQVGLPNTGRRRTPGLRREEVATLAGISLTWYTWLEQGRDIQVSDQVVASLVNALKLTDSEAAHLYTLTGVAEPASATPFTEEINPILQRTIDTWPLSGVVVIDSRWNFVATNKLAEQFAEHIVGHPLVGQNLLREMFTDKNFYRVIGNWQNVASNMVGRFRQLYAAQTNDVDLASFVKQLRQDSPAFDKLWSQHDIVPEVERGKTMLFPKVGEVYFDETNFIVGDNTDLHLYAFTPSDAATVTKINQIIDEPLKWRQ
ncbi:MAG TPA: transcriptional regulator [Lactobacillus sp.]|nr:transcriptional regulator [Lactobacillus sp.]